MSNQKDLLELKKYLSGVIAQHVGEPAESLIVRESAYCIKCLKYHESFVEQCDCGSKDFIYGDVVTYNDNFSCSCKKNSFKLVFHINAEGASISSYRCTHCNSLHGTEIFIER